MADNNYYYSHGGNNSAYIPGGNNAYYQPGGNAYGQPYGNAYYQPGGNQQYYMQDPQQDKDDEDSSMNFNPLEWFFTFLHYWYLFVIALAISLGLAMLKNRRWIPTYFSQGTLVIKENAGYGGSNFALMQGFSILLRDDSKLVSCIVKRLSWWSINALTLVRMVFCIK